MDLARYAELFRTESREHLAEIDNALLALERDADPAQIAVLFRSTHTIKGMAASMGYGVVEAISHALETLLDALRSGARSLDADVIALLFDATDALSASVNDAVDGRNESNASLSALLQRLASSVESRKAPARGLKSGSDAIEASSESNIFPESRNDPDASQSSLNAHGGMFAGTDATTSGAARNGSANGEPAISQPEKISATEKVVEVRLSPDAALKGVRALMVLARIEALGTVRSINPAQHTWNDDAFDGTLTIALSTAADDERIENAARSAGDVARVSVRQPTASQRERETLRHVRIDLRRLDTLLDLVGELVITRDRLVRTAETHHDAARDRALSTAVHDTSRLISALQEEVLQTRMVPVGQVFDRFPRLVRDVARDLGKEIAFTTEGREIELDRSLLDAIGDPIVHLLRNAIDHGIETPEMRRNAGKPPGGRLTLRAARDRAAVIVQVEDDGGGINRDKVLARARAEGLVEADTTTLSDDALLRVLSKAGFSTAASVTSVSGRGVGIDVVASRVRALGGALELSTVTGRGSLFTLRLPVTLAIVRALLVRVGRETYALPSSHVIEALEFDPATLLRIRGQETVTLRDDVIPLLRMRSRFGLGPDCDDGSHIVMVEAAGRQTALQVDSLIGQQDIVVKPYDAVRGAETLFAGATILGDGTPALIVDLASLT